MRETPVDRFVVGLSYDMTTWICGDYRLKCNVSSPLFIVLFVYHMHYGTALSHYHGLPTYTAIEYMLSGLLRDQNNYPLVPLRGFRI
jgi:hypothetical protein